MKKIVSAILAIILSLSLAPSVFADHSISNVILESGCPHDQGAANQEGYRLITATGDQYTIQMPAPGMYFYTPESMYVDAEMNHSIYVYQKPDGKKEKLMPFAYEGSLVQAFAEDGGFTCIVYQDETYRTHAGWVYTSSLSWYYPGVALTVCEPCASSVFMPGDPMLNWSRNNFVGSRQKYTVLDMDMENCVQFKLEYQVLNRNGAETSEVLGARSIYVNDGSGWLCVGNFCMSEIETYLVTVNPPKPMNILAVATASDCPAADTLKMRQTVLDFMTV